MFDLFVHVKWNLRNSLDFDKNAIFVTYLNIYLFILFLLALGLLQTLFSP